MAGGSFAKLTIKIFKKDFVDYDFYKMYVKIKREIGLWNLDRLLS